MDSGWREGRKVEAVVRTAEPRQLEFLRRKDRRGESTSPGSSATDDVARAYSRFTRSFSSTATGDRIPSFSRRSLRLLLLDSRSCERAIAEGSLPGCLQSNSGSA